MEINSSGHRHRIWYNARFILGNETINKINIKEIELFSKHGIRFKNPGRKLPILKNAVGTTKNRCNIGRDTLTPEIRRFLSGE